MTRPKDRIVGTAKELVGEIVGDGALAKEGSRQKRDPGTTLPEKDKPEPSGLSGLNQLT
jgi:hypothetical protein